MSANRTKPLVAVAVALAFGLGRGSVVGAAPMNKKHNDHRKPAATMIARDDAKKKDKEDKKLAAGDHGKDRKKHKKLSLIATAKPKDAKKKDKKLSFGGDVNSLLASSRPNVGKPASADPHAAPPRRCRRSMPRLLA